MSRSSTVQRMTKDRLRPVFRAVAKTVLPAVTALVLQIASATTASADPDATAWAELRMCESSGRYAVHTGNGYYGAYQFDLATWQSVGGQGRPDQASNREQDYRALYLYRMRGW